MKNETKKFKTFIFFTILAVFFVSTIQASPQPVSNSLKFEKIMITNDDITTKKYEVLGKIEVKVNSNDENVPEKGIEKLRKFAYSIGADAVIFVKFTKDKNDFSTQNMITVSGLAIKFK